MLVRCGMSSRPRRNFAETRSREPAPAEEAFLTATAVAQQQNAKSFKLRAALSLAKLYQSSGRAADAHAVLAPALECVSPTREFPEITSATSDANRNNFAEEDSRVPIVIWE
jgi:predicted ATPase